MHLVVDGYGADPGKLTDEDLLFAFLDEYPAAIGMTKMIAPQVYTYRGRTPEDWGLSGFVLIAESHISVHTFPDRGYVNIDVFSCKEFDADASLEEREEDVRAGGRPRVDDGPRGRVQQPARRVRRDGPRVGGADRLAGGRSDG